MPLPKLPPSLGRPVTTRAYSLLEMVVREWGSEFNAPDHGVYEFANGARRFDSTDMGHTGIYGPQATSSGGGGGGGGTLSADGTWTADSVKPIT